jgi:short-subunit dehydrogenase
MAVYFATKAYVLSFSEAIAEELLWTGVTVTTLCPGPTESEFARTANLIDSKSFSGKLPSSKEVARYAFAAMMAGARVAIHGTLNALMVHLVAWMPRSFVTKIVKKMQSKK